MRTTNHYITMLLCGAFLLLPFHLFAQSNGEKHYHVNDNFQVMSDSILLIQQSPEENLADLPIDTFALYRTTVVAVVDIRHIPTDTIDSVWVQVAAAQDNFGWVRETQLLPHVAPDNPTSLLLYQAGKMKHIAWLLIIIGAGMLGYCRKITGNENIFILHLRDIPSPYPTALAICVALFAVVYATIQAFLPEVYASFYYHPSLNPFTQPLPLAICLILFWGIIVLSIASIDETFKLLTPRYSVTYLLTTAVIMAAVGTLFLYTTPIIIGYPLSLIYIVYALYGFLHNQTSHFICGYCGKMIRQKGKCPHCDAINN